MSRIGFALLALVAILAAAPADLDAQGRGQQRREPAGQDRDRNGDIADVILGRQDDVREDSRGNGPPFCQNGQGHPVHGREWCRDKGYGSGYGLDDVIFRDPRRTGRLNQGGILEQIGDVVFGRVQQRSYELGARDPLYGTWSAPSSGGQMLTIRSGNMIIAELIDQTLDGRVDVFRLR